MRDLMADDRGESRFIFRDGQDAGVDANFTAGQTEGIRLPALRNLALWKERLKSTEHNEQSTC